MLIWKKKQYRLNSNTYRGWTNAYNSSGMHKSGFPRKKVNEFDGVRLNRKAHRCMTQIGWKFGGSWDIIQKQTYGLLTKYIGKPFDEFMRVYSDRMKSVKNKFIPECGFTSLENYLYEQFIWSVDRPNMLKHAWKGWHLFEVDENGLIQEHIL